MQCNVHADIQIIFSNHKIQPTNITVKVASDVKQVGETELRL